MTRPALQSVGEFCEQFGFHKGTLYQMIRRRQIPAIKTGVKRHGIKLDPAKVLAAMEQPAEPAGTAETAAR